MSNAATVVDMIARRVRFECARILLNLSSTPRLHAFGHIRVACRPQRDAFSKRAAVQVRVYVISYSHIISFPQSSHHANKACLVCQCRLELVLPSACHISALSCVTFTNANDHTISCMSLADGNLTPLPSTNSPFATIRRHLMRKRSSCKEPVVFVENVVSVLLINCSQLTNTCLNRCEGSQNEDK